MSTNHHHYLQYHHGVAFEKTLWPPRLLKILSNPTEKSIFLGPHKNPDKYTIFHILICCYRGQ